MNGKLDNWKQIPGWQALLARSIATAFGAGLVPNAPGTAGALAAVPLAYFSHAWSNEAQIILWCALFVSGVWASRVMDKMTGKADNQQIVMDEVVGLGITAYGCGFSWQALAVAFILFRFFDIVKPFPVRQVDQWSKKMSAVPGSASASWWGGLGVMLDDVIAGLQGLLIMRVLLATGVLSS